MNKTLLVAVILGSVALPAIGARKYEVDSTHSSIIFRVNHLGVANFYGRFNDVSGHFVLDPDDAKASRIEVAVKADSVDTNSQGRDKHLRGPDFFNAKEFPVIAFRSKEVKYVGEKRYEASGDFTLHGVTKLLTVTIEHIGEAEARGGMKSGFEAVFTIKRSDFGMNYMLGGLGDEVKLMVGIEGKEE